MSYLLIEKIVLNPGLFDYRILWANYYFLELLIFSSTSFLSYSLLICFAF